MKKEPYSQATSWHLWAVDLDTPVDIFGTVVGESPDCLLLSGTVVGENPDYVCWDSKQNLGHS